MNATEIDPRRRAGWGWEAAGFLLALVTVGAAYGLARSNLDFGVQIFVVAGLLLALALLAYQASRAGRAAMFVAVAILLPYLLVGAYAYGQAQRLSNALDDVFGEQIELVPDETYPEEFPEPEGTETPEGYVPLEPNPDATGDDLNDDGTPDDAYEGQICMSESSGEVQHCMLNGGVSDGH